ncbi:MAG: PEP-CTERM sorting domain-containing protein [Pirellulales bacterium]|nr:PEP-CTERM sorting domain-containing protein [Pirellulales bacterium]
MGSITVPEPASLTLISLSTILLGLFRRFYGRH